MARVADGSTVLRQACATAEQTFNRVAQLEDQQASDELREVLTGVCSACFAELLPPS